MRTLLFILIILLLNACSSKSEVAEDIDQIDNPDIIICSDTDIAISAEDNIVIQHATNPVVWKGTYNETSVQINFTKGVGASNETEKFTFVFNKVNNCLEKDRAYKFYDGQADDVSAITEVEVLEFYTKEWELDKKFTGLIVYIDPHDKQQYSRKFWIEFTAENKEIENTDYLLFSDCFENKLPIDIDPNNDGIVDFKMIYELTRDIGNKPQFNIYSIKLVSTNESENAILSPKNTQSPYSVVFEAPFTSDDKRQYFNGVKAALDVFYEFDAPYQDYNFFLNNNLTYQKTLENNKEDYYIISMNLGNDTFYGWIKFNFNSSNCVVEIEEIYLNPVANEHVSVN